MRYFSSLFNSVKITAFCACAVTLSLPFARTLSPQNPKFPLLNHPLILNRHPPLPLASFLPPSFFRPPLFLPLLPSRWTPLETLWSAPCPPSPLPPLPKSTFASHHQKQANAPTRQSSTCMGLWPCPHRPGRISEEPWLTSA